MRARTCESASGGESGGRAAGPEWSRTTHWSVVCLASQSGAPGAREALETLCRNYWYPLYAYTRRRGHGPEEAQDLTQEFFARLLERNDFARADPDKGRFRSFLLGALNHFLAYERRKSQAVKRGGGQALISLDEKTAEDLYRREAVFDIREIEPQKPSTRLTTLVAADERRLKTQDSQFPTLNSQPEDRASLRRLLQEKKELISLLRGDLDWIVMKCLEKDRTRRYETASALALDIENYLKHQPVTAAAPTLRYRLAKFARRNRTALAVGAAFVLLFAAGTVVSVWEAVRATRARVLAERREAEGREDLWASYLATARASRTSGRPGRRFAALEAAAKAAAIRPSIELRSEAASAMALPDVQTAREWEGRLPGSAGIAIDRGLERYACSDEHGDVTLRRVGDGRELLVLPGAGVPQSFSPDGRFLAAIQATPRPQVRLWNLDTPSLVWEAPLCVNGRVLDFHPSAPVFVAAGPAGVVQLFDLATGRRWSWQASNELGSSRFRPDGQQLAIASPNGDVRVYAADSGKLVTTLAHSNAVRRVDWSGDGRLLAAPCEDGGVYLWNMSQGGTLERELVGHDGVVHSVCFDPRGEFLVSQSWDGTSALWSLSSRSLIFKLPAYDFPLAFSADGRWLGPCAAGGTLRLLEVARAPACRVVVAANTCREGAFSPDARWLVFGGTDGLHCWDARTAQRVWSQPAPSTRGLTFRPDGRVLLTLEETGPREWPWSVDEADVPRLGEPRRLPAGYSSQAEYNRDGSVLVMSQLDGLRVFDTRADGPILLPMAWCNFATVSPDGRWAAASPWGGRAGLKIWELPTGREVFHLTNANPALAFTRDRRWLVMAWRDFDQALEVGTWRTVAQVPHETVNLFPLAVSPDNRWAAREHGGRGRLQLCDLPHLRPVLSLDAASESPMCFSPDGALLLTRRSGGQFALWDLRRVREELTSLGLGW